MRFTSLFFILTTLTLSFCSSKNNNPSEITAAADSGKQQDADQPEEVITVQQLTPEEIAKGTKASLKLKAAMLANQNVKLYKITIRGKELIDSIQMDASGSGSAKPFIREKCFALIELGSNQNVFLFMDTASKMEVVITANNPIKYTVKGNDESKELNALAQVNADFILKAMNLRKEIEQNSMLTDAERNRKQMEYEKTVEDLHKQIDATAASLKTPLAKLFAIELMNANVPANEEIKAANELRKGKQFEWTAYFLSRTDSRTKTAIGVPAPEIKMSTPDGRVDSLSSLRGKYVLIDFWASWCGPCRRDNPYVVQLYNTYKPKGFEIFGVSLDNNLDKWKGAIAADGLTWKHVSDLKQWQSAAAGMYSVSSIPYTVLLDKEGKIIAKGLRGEALAAKLRELMP